MVSNSLIQHLKIRVILISATLASTTASVAATVPNDVASLTRTANAFAYPNTFTKQSIVQLNSFPRVPVQLAQSTAIVYPTLRAGSAGETVSRLQATLKLLGFYQGNVDGAYGQSTQQAVIAFQTAADLTADGITGPATWRRLLPAPGDINAAAADTSSGEVTSVESPTEPVTTETDSEPVASGPPILRPSAEGTAVSQLQEELQTLGYYNGAIDGSYGELTEAAVREFQADQQLIVDAVVGPATWDALSRALKE